MILGKWNVPGTPEYDQDKPIDVILLSSKDVRLRGYWLSRDPDGQLIFVSNQNEADHVSIAEDTDGTYMIQYDPELSSELSFDGFQTIYLRTYS